MKSIFLRLSCKLIAICLAEIFFFVEPWIFISFFNKHPSFDHILRQLNLIHTYHITNEKSLRNYLHRNIYSSLYYFVSMETEYKSQLLMIVLLGGGNRRLFISCVSWYYCRSFVGVILSVSCKSIAITLLSRIQWFLR
jgi:hypothetical protein